ncbi:hypothetical protein QAD02_000678 [Eretmocerus hayati]|uniref:Uncharacterized protein n=1 Tax=Eretmocerus hayati TaxID=131215 RepID=A0ACC2NEC1_9HYME|nr:hypothetical protein QAD02_000678 [Eretmocerus hayati]
MTIFTNSFCYHLKNCFKNYTRRMNDRTNFVENEEPTNDSIISEESNRSILPNNETIVEKSKRQVEKYRTNKDICIICGQDRCKGSNELKSLVEIQRARTLFEASRYFAPRDPKDEVRV